MEQYVGPVKRIDSDYDAIKRNHKMFELRYTDNT